VASAVVTRRNDSIPSTWNGPRLANTNTNLPLCLSNLRTAPITTDDDFKGPSTPQLLVTVSTYGSGPEPVVRVSIPGTLSSREPRSAANGKRALTPPARYSVGTYKTTPLAALPPLARGSRERRRVLHVEQVISCQARPRRAVPRSSWIRLRAWLGRGEGREGHQRRDDTVGVTVCQAQWTTVHLQRSVTYGPDWLV
jgi:hypothetical protein